MKITKKYIDTVLAEAGKVDKAEGTITECIVSVAKNEANQKIYINHLNELNNSLVKDELKTFKKSVHKIQMITRKGKTQKVILGDDKAKTHKWNIVICKQNEIDNKLATEAERGKYKAIELKKPEATEPEALTLADTVVNWMQDNEPDGLANPLRKAYVADIVNTSQMLLTQVGLLKGTK
jgi:hypothetical protein